MHSIQHENVQLRLWGHWYIHSISYKVQVVSVAISHCQSKQNVGVCLCIICIEGELIADIIVSLINTAITQLTLKLCLKLRIKD